MAVFHLTIVCPESVVYDGDVEQADLPGAEGDFGVLVGHALFVSALRPGLVAIAAQGRIERAIVLEGIAEFSGEVLTVLANAATLESDLDPAELKGRIDEIEGELTTVAPGPAADRIALLLADYRTLYNAMLLRA